MPLDSTCRQHSGNLLEYQEGKKTVMGKALIIRPWSGNHQLLLWMGVNSFRTSQLADKQGFMVISECAAVSLKNFSSQLLENHKTALKELVGRDKNHPSVIIWSVANEPLSYMEEADSYFASIRDEMKSLDQTRPITAVHYDYPDQDYATDHVARHMDIIGVNKYSAWYTDPGHTELITRQIVSSLRRWREAHGKPLTVTEYGADTVAGLHALPGLQFSEDFQLSGGVLQGFRRFAGGGNLVHRGDALGVCRLHDKAGASTGGRQQERTFHEAKAT